jgi:hypothetical protein
MDRKNDRSCFHLVMACVFLGLALAGFGRSYWLKLVDGSFDRPPIYHVHGALMTAWFVLYVTQTWQVHRGRLQRHRDWGLAGIALFTLVLCTMFALTLHGMGRDFTRAGGHAEALQFPVASLVSIPLAGALFAFAIGNIRRPEVHKRLMLMLMVVLVQAAVARLVVLPLVTGPPTPAVIIPTALVTDLLLLAALLRDWIVDRRVHVAYLVGAPLTVAAQLLAVPFGGSAAGIATGLALMGLMGRPAA